MFADWAIRYHMSNIRFNNRCLRGAITIAVLLAKE